MMMLADVGAPKQRDPYQPFLLWALLFGCAFFILHCLRACVEGLPY